MSRKKVVAAGLGGVMVGGVVFIQAGSDTNGDGFLEFVDGEVITADDINTNFDRAADHVTRYENAVLLNNDDKVGLGGLPLSDESLYIFQDETGAGDHLNLRLEKGEGGEMIQLSDGDDFGFSLGIDSNSDYAYLGTTSHLETLSLKNGRVGVNKIEPDATLDVIGPYASGGLSPQVHIGYQSTHGLFLAAKGNVTHYNWLIGQQDLATGLTFTPSTAAGGSTFTTPALTLREDGKVGIGTTSPGHALDVSGTARATAFVGDGSGLTGIGGLSQWSDVSGGISYTAGNVGIGTATPGSKLDIAGNLRMTGTNPTLTIYGDATSYYPRVALYALNGTWSGGIMGYANSLLVEAGSGGDIYLRSGGAELMRVVTTGKVGIGTSTPQATLDVVGGGVAISGFSNGNSGTAGGMELGWDGAKSVVQSYNRAGGAFTPLFFSGSSHSFSNGNVGIYTTVPGAALDVRGDIRLGDTTNSTSVRWQGPNNWDAYLDTTTDKFSIRRNSADKLVIDSAGNVGIGTSTPRGNFDVNGRTALFGAIPVTMGYASNGYPGIGYNFLAQSDGTYKYAGGDTAYMIGLGQGHRYDFNYAASGSAGSTISWTPAMSITNEGKVGIGTTSPVGQFSIGGTGHAPISGSGNSYGMYLYHDTGSGVGYVDVVTGSTAVTHLALRNYNGGTYNTLFYGKNDGNVAIGHTSPASKLDVAGETKSTNFYVSKSSYTLAQNAGDTWIRIASGNGNSFGHFRFIWATSSQHGNIEFIASCNYPSSDSQCTINMLHWNEHGYPGVKKLRFVRNSTYDTYYLEFMAGNNPTTTNQLTIEVKDLTGYTMLTPAAGSIPSGYTTQEVTTESLRLALGNGTLNVTTGNQVGIGTATASYKLHVNGDVGATAFTTISDARLKKGVQPIESALQGIQCLTGVTFFWKNPEWNTGRQMGLIAQEVEQCFPELVTTSQEGIKGVLYAQLVAPLIEAVKEMAGLMDDQQEQIIELEDQVASQHLQIEAQQQKMAAQQKMIDLLIRDNHDSRLRLTSLEADKRTTDARLVEIEGLIRSKK